MYACIWGKGQRVHISKILPCQVNTKSVNELTKIQCFSAMGDLFVSSCAGEDALQKVLLNVSSRSPRHSPRKIPPRLLEFPSLPCPALLT